MEGEGSEQQVVKSAVAAHKLGISKTRLNRLAPIYEQVHGELPRGGRHARLWTLDAIERIRSALLAVEEGRALNVEAALRGFETPENTESRHMSVRISGEAPETLAPLSALEERGSCTPSGKSLKTKVCYLEIKLIASSGSRRLHNCLLPLPRPRKWRL